MDDPAPEADDLGPGDVLQAVLERSGYLADLEQADTVESHGRIENLGELVGSAREFTRIDEFLEQVSLVADTDELSGDDRVVLMTLHAAKGLEFPYVFLIGVEEAFMRLGVPYQVVGGTRFYDRREIKDALAYLRAVVNPADEVSVKRVLNVPKRGIGDTSVARLDEFAAAEGVTFLDACRRAHEAGVGGRAAKGLESFCGLIDEVRAAMDDPAPEADDLGP
ncbi:MAG: 3'-5' exonuclease, partial [Ilumatobacteraceae bacterium]